MDKLLLERLKKLTNEEKNILNGKMIDPEVFSGKNYAVVSNDRINQMGQQIILSQHYRFTEIPKHTHQYIELCYVCSGELVHKINDTHNITLKAGELVLLNHHAYHSIKKCGENDIAVNFLVLPEFFDTTMTVIGSDNLLGSFLINAVSEKNRDISFLHFRVSDIITVQNLVENLVYNIIDKKLSSVKAEKFTMALLFLELLRYSQRVTVNNFSGAESLVFEALKEIEDNSQNPKLSSVAKRNHVSSAYLSRVIKENTGKSFKEILLEKRLSSAKELLENTSVPIAQIAQLVGYDNTSFFYRKFKGKFNLTPKQIRDNQK